MDELTQILEHFISPVWTDAIFWFSGLWAVILFIRKVSKDADDELDPDKRKALAKDLEGIITQDSGAWISDFIDVFDRFFGKKHFRRRCFNRSALISIFTFFVLTCIHIIDVILAFHSGVPSDKFSEYSFALASVIGFTFIGVAFFVNILADYLSLLETRILLNTKIPVVSKILFDAILTFVITYLWTTFCLWIFYILNNSELKGFTEMLQIIWIGYFFNDGSIIPELMTIIVLTSYTTSIWLWLHGLSRLLIRFISGVNFFAGWLNIKERPLRAIGTTINAIVLLIGIVLFPFFEIAK